MGKLDQYLANRDLMKTGDMLEWRSSSLLGKAIRMFTKKDVNHTGTVFIIPPQNNEDEAHVYTLEAAPKKYESNRLSACLEKFEGEVYWYPLNKYLDALRNKGIGWLLEQDGKEYDYGSLFRNMAGSVNTDARKLFCSEAHFFYLVISGMLPQFYFDVQDNVIRNVRSGSVAKSPRPGEFGQFNIYEKRVQIL